MKAERKRHRLTASEVADAVGVNTNQIFRWESGIQEPSASRLLKLAGLYQCSPDYLLGLTDEREKQEIARQAVR